PKPTPLAALPPLPPADDSIEFQGIRDLSALEWFENPAYSILLNRVRETPADKLRADSRRDIVFSQLATRPKRYRCVPIHLEGVARRILYQDVKGSKIFPKGRYYEASVFTPDSQPNPYLLVFEDAPPGLASGNDVWEHVAFDGYFFKLMS